MIARCQWRSTLILSREHHGSIMNDRNKLILGIAIALLALGAVVVSSVRTTSPASAPLVDTAPIKPEVTEFLQSFRAEVQPTDDTVHQIIDDFEKRVAAIVRKDAPSAPSPDNFAAVAKRLLERILIGTGPGTNELTHLTSIGLDQMSARVAADKGKELLLNEAESSGFGNLTLQPSPGAFPDRDRVAKTGPLTVELRVPMKLPADPPTFTNRVIVPVGIRLAWDKEKHTWVFWNYTVLHNPGQGVLSPGF